MKELIEISEFVVDQVAMIWPGSSPQRTWLIIAEITEPTDNPLVWVRPVNASPEEDETRKKTRYTGDIDIVVQQKLSDLANATIDPLVQQMSDIMAHFDRVARRFTLASGNAAWINRTSVSPADELVLSSHLNQYRQFGSVIRLGWVWHK